jgi:hypothetical protein
LSYFPLEQQKQQQQDQQHDDLEEFFSAKRTNPSAVAFISLDLQFFLNKNFINPSKNCFYNDE